DFAGLKKQTFPASLIQHLPHGDEARTQFFDVKDRWTTWLTNRAYRVIKFDLMRLQGGALPRLHREEIYKLVAQMLPSIRQGRDAEMTIVLPVNEHLPQGLVFERQLKYTLRLQPDVR